MADLKRWTYRGLEIEPTEKSGMNWKIRFNGGRLYFKTKKSVKKNLSRILKSEEEEY